MGPRRHWPARALLIALEGPRRPWWLPVAMFVGGVAGGATGVASNSAPLVLLGVPMALLALFWTFTRLAQFYYYLALGRTTDFTRCIRCGYSLQGLGGTVCPECGTDSPRLAAGAARATGLRPPDR